MTRNTKLAQRIGAILFKLNQGERLDTQELADEFNVSLRTIQRDFCERLNFLEWEECGDRFYKIDRKKLGILTDEDIQRFALFSSINHLFPQIDRTFYQEKLLQSIQVKGIDYEKIEHLASEFESLNQAIQNHQQIIFYYIKNGNDKGKYYKVCPYCLTNKNGVWYIIATEQNKQKTFCFTQIKQLKVLPETFIPNTQLIAEIKENDTISFGNQLPEVVIQVSKFAAPYFIRRALLPNQNILHKLEDGGLLISCKNVHELDITPTVQYWIPHLTIISPVALQTTMIEKLQHYLINHK